MYLITLSIKSVYLHHTFLLCSKLTLWWEGIWSRRTIKSRLTIFVTNEDLFKLAASIDDLENISQIFLNGNALLSQTMAGIS